MKEFIEKIKVTSLEIIVTGTVDKHYFEIKYKEVGRKDYNIGYSSYDLNNVFGWKEDCFEIVNQLAEEYDNDVCEWKQHEREIDVYFTECGQAHIFVDGNPEENNHVFCPYCGKKIKIAPYQPKGE